MKIVSGLLLTVLVTTALAQTSANKSSAAGDDRRSPPHSEHRGPPPEALAVCKNAKTNAACSFSGRQGEALKGTCWTPDKSKPLACKPSDMPPQGAKPPPAKP